MVMVMSDPAVKRPVDVTVDTKQTLLSMVTGVVLGVRGQTIAVEDILNLFLLVFDQKSCHAERGRLVARCGTWKASNGLWGVVRGDPGAADVGRVKG
ncbi:hypothetical protein MGG_17309 [Pyricularia oryzae 70-15]|uniref:Uncharacterized protein n=1 Tax=Pyricularia oryzae (strain 70-15 / ATCC MYA-4617 / FGSC 8958) TaxID=242507 RepID=G4NBV0_PYRO7|nr:uncharacterized protein MGG_17309 [Pyricularia oryzae 70-15]EHA48152.1 hypothetical protein MGG_17309 [Pyricularia oryzae 70-15]